MPVGSDGPNPSRPPSDPERIERLITLCLERIDSEGESALEAVCSEHPALASEIREGIGSLRELGLLGSAESTLPGDSGSFPERLGEFRLIRRLGGGGMGVVYLAEQEALRRRVALKLVRPENLFFPAARDRFRREVESVARLQHPGIVPIHTVGEAAGIPFYTMDWIDGRTLAEVLQRTAGRELSTLSGGDLRRSVDRITSGGDGSAMAGPISRVFDGSWVESSFQILIQVAEALHHAHERGVVHRDVKPSNIMLTPDGRAILLDFGLARVQGADKLTRTSSPLGSLPYMSPEQLLGDASRVDRRTDVYSLGVTLYEMLALEVPYRASTAEAVGRRVITGRPPRVSARNPAVSPDAEAVCAKAMAAQTANRYATCLELAADMQRVIDRRAVEAPALDPRVRARRFLARHRGLAVAAAISVVVSVGAVAWFLHARSTRFWSDCDARLADVTRLLAAAPELWPASPTKLEAIRRWRSVAHGVANDEARFRDALAALRAEAMPYGEDDRSRDGARNVDERARLIAKRRALIETIAAQPSAASWERVQLAMVESALGSAQATDSNRKSLRFGSTRDEERFGRLDRLLEGFRDLATASDAVDRLEAESFSMQFVADIGFPSRLDVRKLSDATPGSEGWLAEAHAFGNTLAVLEARDGDGAPRLVIGETWYGRKGEEGGRLWIAKLGVDGRSPEFLVLCGGDDPLRRGLRDSRTLFISDLARLPDMDADGVDELAIGTQEDHVAGLATGAVWIARLDTDSASKTARRIAPARDESAGQPMDDMFGDVIDCAGDVDGDGAPDLVVGAPYDGDGGNRHGAIWIVFLDHDASEKRRQKISSWEGGFVGALDNLDYFGDSVAALGDFDGDGVGDVAVGSRFDDDGGSNVGAVWLLFLNRDGTLKRHEKISAAEGGFAGLLRDSDQFGRSLAALGDVDGDGVGDLAVGAPGDDDGGIDHGAVWLLFLRRDGTVKAYRKISSTQGGFAGALDVSDEFGSALAALRESPDGRAVALAIGATGDDDGAPGRGAVWIVDIRPKRRTDSGSR